MIVAADRATTVARVMIVLQLINIGLRRARQQRIDGIIVVTLLRRAVNQTLAPLPMGPPVQVVGPPGGHQLWTDNALFQAPFLHTGRGVPLL